MIWLIGDRGMLGQELGDLLDARDMAWIGSDREVDIRDVEALRGFARGKDIDRIVNCSAYTDVDKAEEEEELARSINATGAGNIAALATKLGASMIHISTDYVFRGDGKRPYIETDPTEPAGAYGRNKAEGERLVAAACPRHFIIRTAWLYGKHGPNFVYTMLRLMKERGSLNVVADQRGTPTWTRDLAAAIADILSSGTQRYGTYHYTNEGETSWYGFATEIERFGRKYGILGHGCTLKMITSDQYPSKAKRPEWSVLSKEKIRKELGIEPPGWEESLRAFFENLTECIDDARDIDAMARYDLDTAQAMLQGSRYLYVAYTCQQALEKTIKTILIIKGRNRRIHNLMELARSGGFSLEAREIALLERLTEFYLKGRYPRDTAGLIGAIDRESATVICEEANRLCEKLRKHPAFSIL